MTKKLLISKIITNIFQKGKPKANTLLTKPIPLKHFLSIDIHIFPVLRKQDIVNWPANLFFSSKVYKNKSVWNRKCTLFPIFQKPHKNGINTKSFLFLTSSLYTNPALQIPPKKKKKTEEVSRFKIKKITLRKKILKVARVKFNAYSPFPTSMQQWLHYLCNISWIYINRSRKCSKSEVIFLPWNQPKDIELWFQKKNSK